jgi:hypothetical protein
MSGTYRIVLTGLGWGWLSLLSNISYAGMRAQHLPETNNKRTIAFMCGFPQTIVSYLVVDEGSNKAYGIKL